MSRKQSWTKVEIGPGVEEGHFFWVESDAEGVLHVQGTKPGCGVMVTRTTTSRVTEQTNKRLSSGQVREAIDAMLPREKAGLFAELQDAWESLPDENDRPEARD